MRRVLMTAAVSFVLLAGAGVCVSPALALSPWWHLAVGTRPSTIAPGGEGTIVVLAANLGDAATMPGASLSDVLPAGLSVVESGGVPEVSTGGAPSECGVAGRRVSCTLTDEEIAQRPYETVEMKIVVKAGGASREENEALVSGGGAAVVRVERPVVVSGAPVVFGVEDYGLVPEEEGGGVDAQAGSHPFQLTTSLAFNQTGDPTAPPALPRNLHFRLPPGVVGNALALPQCTEAEFSKILSSQNFCPADSVVGVIMLTLDEPKVVNPPRTFAFPIFNLVTPPGEPARFGFTVFKTPVTIDTFVRTGSDYGVTTNVSNISEVINFISELVVFWGVPNDPRHDQSRGWACLTGGSFGSLGERCPTTDESNPAPFLTLPTSCTTPFASSVSGDSWPKKPTPGSTPEERRSVPLPKDANASYSLQDAFGLGLTGCNQLAFSPFIEAAPDVQEASKPSGLTVHVRVPQEVSENGQGLSSSNVRNITVALAEGVSLNPAGAGGLQACSGDPADRPGAPGNQIGFQGSAELNPETEPGVGTLLFTPTVPEALSPGLDLASLGFCPNASKIGTVKIASPLIANPLQGSVYLASQDQNPFGTLVAIYIVAEDPVSGTLVKLPGKLSLCEAAGEVLEGVACQAPGQIVTTFKDEPQLPFEDAELHFFGGERAPLSTPAHCGTYTTRASLTPWSGTPPVTSTSSFQIATGPNGGPCPGVSLPFYPSFTGGTTNIDAGSFSPFTSTFSRSDGNQDIQAVQLRMPPGLLGMVSSVKPCPEEEANAGTCGPQSLVGHTIVSVGVGNDPYSVTGGEVFLTGPYRGAPYGLSIVNPARAGPFDLGRVIVRARIEVDPLTANLTVTTDPSPPYAIPHILDGIPLQIQHVNVTIDRPGFTFNPTDCDPLELTGSLTSDQGTRASLNVPFQATNCALLGFKPKLTVTTNGKASRRNGTSLQIKIAYPPVPGRGKGAMGREAWFSKAKFAFPKQLPARLTTLQKACPEATFNQNPAACPPGSRVGTALVHTQVLPGPLTGVVYFVSYGGAKFPEAVIVLQGDNVTVDLHAETDISKAGVTSATLKSIPGVPFENVTVTLPSGPGSEFAATANLCTTHPTMKTAFQAQNGLALKQTTALTVTGCPHHKARRAGRRGPGSGGHKGNGKRG